MLLLQAVSEELLEVKTRKQYVESNPQITINLLKEFIAGGNAGGNLKALSEGGPPSSSSIQGSNKVSASSTADMKKLKESSKKLEQEILELKSRLTDADFETKRLTEQLKLSRQTASEISEQLYLSHSERDFFRMKWEELSPHEAMALSSSVDSAMPSINKSLQDEKKNYTNTISNYLKEIDDLKQQLASERANKTGTFEMFSDIDGSFSPHEVDTEFTSAITALIAQTRSQLEEESKLLLNIESNGTTKEDDEDDSEEKAKKVDDLEEERAFAKRQRLMNTEVFELGQSIQLKEQLMSQLIKSQQQYGVMKSYYEQKLTVISAEMHDKQQERDKLEAELQDIVNKKSETTLLKQRETKLRDELRHKDDELSKMKKKQDELKNLTQVQQQYTKQLAKLECDITSMKRQRVDLSKTLQNEKKNHMLALSEKAKEIEKLKKELFKASSEVKKLGRSKEIAESKAKDAIREGVALKKKTQELMKALPSQELTTTASARAAIRAMSKSSTKLVPRRFMTEEELRTKKWIDLRINEISAREAAADALKRQYEQQLELLQRKEALEKERSLAISRSATFDFIDRDDALSLSPSTPLQKKSSFIDGNNDASLLNTPLLSTMEEEKLLEIIEDRLSSINGQLNARNQKISDIHRLISEGGDIPNSDKTVEVLKKTAAGSLQASHELIRLLFDMLIHSNMTIQNKEDYINEVFEKEKTLIVRIEDLQQQLASEKRAFDMELTTINKQYEEKLEALLQHVSGTRPEDLAATPDDVDNIENDDKKSPQRSTIFKMAMSPSSFYNKNNNHSASTNQLLSKKRTSMDNTDMQLAIVTEENKFNKSQLERETIKFSQLQTKVVELEKIKQTLMLDIEDKNIQIRFLEEDRELFRNMTEDLKAGLNAMGKDGKAVVMSVKDRAYAQKRPAGLFTEYLNISDDDDDDTQSIIGEYQNLMEEINRTGGVAISRSMEFPRSHSTSAATSSNQDDIFHRLNNPNNYTGRMRNVFKDDLELKRKKIQEIRNQDFPKKHTRTVPQSARKGDSNHEHEGMNQDPHQMVLGLDMSIMSLNDDQHLDTPTESVPNVFSRLTRNMTGVHKHRAKLGEEVTPRNISPSMRVTESLVTNLQINTNPIANVSTKSTRAGTPNATSALQRLNNGTTGLYSSSMNGSSDA